MKKIYIYLLSFLIIVALLLTIGFYHQNSTNESVDNSKVEIHKGEKLIYTPMGDSLTRGYYASEKDKRYVNVLAQLIKNKLGYDVQIAPGSAQVGTGLKNNAIPNLKKIIAEKPDLITIEFGSNDLKKNHKNAYSNPKEFKKRLEYVVNYLKKHSKKQPKIILITTWHRGHSSVIYDKIIEEVGKEQKIPVANIGTVWKKNRKDTIVAKGAKTFLGKGDGWHPNDKGHKEIADLIFKRAYKLLK